MASSALIQISHPFDRVFEAETAVLPQNKMKVRLADQSTGLITARTAASLKTWGENIMIRLGSSEATATTSTTMVDNGLPASHLLTTLPPICWVLEGRPLHLYLK